MNNFFKAVYAGMSIGLGGIIFLSCENKALGAFLFSIGLLSVLIFQFDLYTGKVCNTTYLKKPVELVEIWFGNFAGAIFMGLLAMSRNSFIDTAESMVAAKLQKSTFNILCDAVICGLCIGIAVKGYQKAEGLGKILAIVLGVMVFILAGAEHIVADMFYFTVGGAETGLRRIGDIIQFLLITTVGNTIGGIIMSFV